MNLKNLVVPAVLVLSLGLVGCQGNGYKASTNSSVSGDSNDSLGSGGSSTSTAELELAKAETAVAEAEAAIADAEALLSKISDSNGGLTLGTASVGDVQAQSIYDVLFGLGDKLTEGFDKVIEQLQKAKSIFSQARQRIADQIAKLNPGNPQHMPIIASLMAVMQKIDMAEAKFSALLDKMAAKIHKLIDQIVKFEQKLFQKNPILAGIVSIFIDQVIDALTKFADKLAAL